MSDFNGSDHILNQISNKFYIYKIKKKSINSFYIFLHPPFINPPPLQNDQFCHLAGGGIMTRITVIYFFYIKKLIIFNIYYLCINI